MYNNKHNNGVSETEALISVNRLLQYIGEDVNREGLTETPARVLRSYSHLYSGYGKRPEDVVKVFENEGYDQIVLLKDIEMYSMCEHHMLPFVGKAHVAYLPDDKVIGLSKLARIVEIYARRLQIQERLTNQIADAVMGLLNPKGAACVIEAQHLCMRMRGVEKQNSIMITSCMRGCFLEKDSARHELMQFIGFRGF